MDLTTALALAAAAGLGATLLTLVGRRWAGGPTGLLRRLVRALWLVGLLFALWGLAGTFPAMSAEGRGLLWGGGLVLVASLGWALLADVLSGGILRLERRVAPGVRVESPTFAGTVVGIGWRTTRLRNPRGSLQVPNRALMSAPLRVSRASEHRLVLGLPPSERSALEIRHRIEDAVHASAWTPPHPDVHVHRDPRDRSRWVVFCRLLDPKFGPDFDAQLPEQLERMERYEQPPPPPEIVS